MAGTATAAFVLETEIVTAPPGPESVTVQIAGMPTRNRLALQAREVRAGAANNVRVALCDTAPNVAVMVAL